MKKIIIAVILFTFVIATSSSVFADVFPVLMYHNITTDVSLVEKDPTVHISDDTMEEHLLALKNANYTTISMDEYYNHCVNGTALPQNPVLITVDDGYISNYEILYPLLKKHDMKATIFVIASRMGAHNVEFPHFSWDHAREMESSGLVEIESHTFTHPDFSRISYADTVVEMRLSKYAIETNLSKECRFFAYPYGKMNASSTAVARAAGYKMVCVGRGVSAKTDGENMYEIPRYTALGNMSGEELISMIK